MDRRGDRQKRRQTVLRGDTQKREREKKWGNVVLGGVNPVDPWIVK